MTDLSLPLNIYNRGDPHDTWVLPQLEGLNSHCDGKVWRVDVGMSSGVLNAEAQVAVFTSCWLGARDLHGAHTPADLIGS